MKTLEISMGSLAAYEEIRDWCKNRGVPFSRLGDWRYQVILNTDDVGLIRQLCLETGSKIVNACPKCCAAVIEKVGLTTVVYECGSFGPIDGKSLDSENCNA